MSWVVATNLMPCFVRHRSRRFIIDGLVPMEAMSLGKLVIATGYSGNVTFMTEQNSLSVPYRLVEPAGDVPFFLRRFAGRNAAWAEPDLVREYVR